MNTTLFIKNKYTKYYFDIIAKSKQRCQSPDTYHERHHIIPKSLGGDNSKENIAILTGREHYVCHLLLVRMTSSKEKSKMCYALHSLGMKNKYTSQRYINSKFYENNKIYLSKLVSENMLSNNPMKNLETKKKHKESVDRRGPTKGTTGIRHSEETKKLMSIKQSGKILSEETKKILSDHNKALWAERRKAGTDKRKPLSEETKRKISETLRNKKKI